MTGTTLANTALVAHTATVVRRDDDMGSRAHFSGLVDRHGREGASRIWVEAVRVVEAECWSDLPPRRAPDCNGWCGESYIDEACEPCQVLEAVRYPAVTPVPYTCGCGVAIPADEHEAIFGHIDQCAATGA